MRKADVLRGTGDLLRSGIWQENQLAASPHPGDSLSLQHQNEHGQMGTLLSNGSPDLVGRLGVAVANSIARLVV